MDEAGNIIDERNNKIPISYVIIANIIGVFSLAYTIVYLYTSR